MKEILRLAQGEHSQELCLLHGGKKKDIQNGKNLVISETEFLEAFMSMKAMMEILLDEGQKGRRKKKDLHPKM